MRIRRIKEAVPFSNRNNTHQTHFEDLVCTGELDELNDKIESFIESNSRSSLNMTTKIDGSPAVICWSKFEGYPDNSICLKSFVTSANNCISTFDEIDKRYGDRPEMAEKLRYALRIAKAIPEGEAWQGDCLFTRQDLKEKEIEGVKYLTFHPNKIIYAFSEENPDYERVKDAEFGICFHTIYIDAGGGKKNQSFNVDASRIKVPEYIYILSPAVDVDEGKFEIEEIKQLYFKLQEVESKLLADNAYDSLIHNSAFMDYWSIFENKNISDKRVTTIDLNTFYEDLWNFIEEKQTKEFQKKYTSLKTAKGKSGAIDKWASEVAELQDILTNYKTTMTTFVEALNLAAEIKMKMWAGFKDSKLGYDTFYLSRTQGYKKASMEGIAMSDSNGNIVKIVDRSEFSANNRDPDIVSGWEHPEDKLKEDMSSEEAANAAGEYYKRTRGLPYDSTPLWVKQGRRTRSLYDYDPEKEKEEIAKMRAWLKAQNKADRKAKFQKIKDAIFGEPSDTLGCGYADLTEGKLKEAADRKTYKATLKAIANYIKESLIDETSLRYPQSSRHEEEICRIDFAKTVSDEDLVVKKVREVLESNTEEGFYLVPNPLSDEPIKVKTDFDLVPGPSGTYKAIKLEVYLNGERLPDSYITDVTHRTDGRKAGAKKLFTPNQVLDQSLFDGSAKEVEDVIGCVNYPLDPLIDNFLKALVTAAKGATTLNGPLAQYITSVASERSNIMPSSSNLALSFQSTPELDQAIVALKESDPMALDRLNNAIGVDFGEVFGSVALASVLEKYGKNNPEMLIKFPAESNCPLVDYFLEPRDKMQEFKVSAKAGAGGKPTVNAPCSTILRMVDQEWGPEKEEVKVRYQNAIDFVRWLQNCMQSSTSVHNSFEKIEEGFLGSLGITDNEGFTFLNEDVSANLETQVDKIAMIHDMEPSMENLKPMVDLTNEVITAIVPNGNDVSFIQESGIWTTDKINAMRTENNIARYFKSLKTKCIDTILINVINNSDLIMDFNDLFNMSFGTFVQIYFKQIQMDVGSTYSFDAVVKSVDGQDIVGKDVYYKLNFDCAIDKDSGLFKVKSLALKLNHKKSINESVKKRLREEAGQTVVCAFGRMNPPTIGHAKLINKMVEIANQIGCGKPKLYLSHSCDPVKNPLTYESKVNWIRKMFGDKIDVVESPAINMFFMAHELYLQGYDNMVYVCGEDRYEDTSRYLHGANGQEFDKKGNSLIDKTYYNFETLEVTDAGHRDENSTDLAEQASASLARKFAMENNLEGFKSIVPLSEDDAIILFDELQTSMGL